MTSRKKPTKRKHYLSASQKEKLYREFDEGSATIKLIEELEREGLIEKTKFEKGEVAIGRHAKRVNTLLAQKIEQLYKEHPVLDNVRGLLLPKSIRDEYRAMKKEGKFGDCSIVTGIILLLCAYCEAWLSFVDALGPARHAAYRWRFAD